MNAGQMIDELLNMFKMDGTIAGLMAAECARRVKQAEQLEDETQANVWRDRADMWDKLERIAYGLDTKAE